MCVLSILPSKHATNDATNHAHNFWQATLAALATFDSPDHCAKIANTFGSKCFRIRKPIELVGRLAFTSDLKPKNRNIPCKGNQNQTTHYLGSIGSAAPNNGQLGFFGRTGQGFGDGPDGGDGRSGGKSPLSKSSPSPFIPFLNSVMVLPRERPTSGRRRPKSTMPMTDNMINSKGPGIQAKSGFINSLPFSFRYTI